MSLFPSDFLDEAKADERSPTMASPPIPTNKASEPSQQNLSNNPAQSKLSNLQDQEDTITSSTDPSGAPGPASPELDTPHNNITGLATQTIEADHDATDSAFGDSSSTLDWGSVTSSIFDFRQENGRTYHAYSDGKYLFPNDEKEQERMDLMYHAILVMFDGRPFFAPVKNPHRIVDMGTGTGIWALDVGDEYPEAHVIGIDLSPIQPKWVAPSVEFRIDDIDSTWMFREPLDLVHSRICKGNAIKDLPKYLAQTYQALKPGGWVEFQESDLLPQSDDGSLKSDSSIVQWHNHLNTGMKLAGYDLSGDSKWVKAQVEAAGFVNVTIIDFKFPLSPWPRDKKLKRAGAFVLHSMLLDLRGLSLAVFTRILGWSVDELEAFLDQVREEWCKASVHAYWPLFVVYGQKPIGAEKGNADTGAADYE